MAFFCENNPAPQPTSTTVVQGTQLPEYIATGGEQLFEQAKQIGRQEYPLFPGPRVAGFSGDENNAFSLARENTGIQTPSLDQSGALIDRGTRKWDSAALDQYINPYQKGVTDVALRDLDTAFQRMRKFRNTDAVSAGAYGGSRQGIRDSLDDEQYLKSAADLSLRGAQTGYESASQRFDADRRAALAGAGSAMDLGRTQSALGSADVLNLLQTGGMQRGQDQASLDTAYGDFLEQRNWPYENLNFVLGALTGVPTNKTTSSTTQGQQFFPQASPLAQGAGAGLSLAALYSSGIFG